MKKKAVIPVLILALVVAMCACACNGNVVERVEPEIEVPVEIRDNKVAVISDIHMLPEEGIATVEQVEYWLDENNKVMPFSKAALMTTIDEIIASGEIKNVLIPGDMSANGNRAEHKTTAQCLKKLKDNGIGVYVIDGNHDIMYQEDGKDDIGLAEFKEIYADFGYNSAIGIHEFSASYSADVGDWRLIALDNNSYYLKDDCTAWHEYPEDGINEWLEAELKRANADGKKVIAMYHQPYQASVVSNLHAGVGEYYTDVMNLLTKYGVTFSLCGHNHSQIVGKSTTEYGTITEVMTASLVYAAPTYRVLDFYEDKVEIKSFEVDSLNPDYLVGGFTEEQKLAVAENYYDYASSHAFDIITSNVRSYVKRYLKKVPIIRDSILAALSTPIYKTDDPEEFTLEGFLEELGLELPASDYKKFSDLEPFYIGLMASGKRDVKIECLENELAKDMLYLIVYYIQLKLNSDLEPENWVDIDFGLLFGSGELEAIDSKFLNKIIAYIDGLHIVNSDLSKLNFTTLEAFAYFAPTIDSLFLTEMKLGTAIKPYIGEMSFDMEGIVKNVVYGDILVSLFDIQTYNHNDLTVDY